MKELISKVEEWAEDRNLIKGATPVDQFMKLAQEAGELSDSICKDKDAKDDIGDNMVVLIIICLQQGIDPHEMLLKSKENDLFAGELYVDSYSTKELFIHYFISQMAIACPLISDGRVPIRNGVINAMTILNIISDRLGLDFEECLQVAYDDIKDRKGIMRDGVFIKQTDLDELAI